MRQKLRRLLLISLCAVLIAGGAPDAYIYTAAGAEEIEKIVIGLYSLDDRSIFRGAR